MRIHNYVGAFALLFTGSIGFAQQGSPAPAAPSPDDQYVAGPDSLPRPGVPKGKIFEFTFENSKIFPGTIRKITVYVPSQYTGDKPACVYVGLDSLAFEAPTVFDNLINEHAMPVTIAIGVAPGVVDSSKAQQNPRFNRSLEFDGLNDNLARFLLDEVLPEVEHRKTPDGLPILLSKDPNDRSAGGGSTGGIGSFTLAWERPDAFRRVFTAIGTFVGMRGGDRYAVLVRKTEPKPIRIFMQDGSNDGLPGFIDEVGDWWMSNQTMERALRFAGYQVEHVWGEGGHNIKHPTAVFPDAMRWLWKDWPQPVVAGVSQNTFLKDILELGSSWQAVPLDDRGAAELSFKSQRYEAVAPDGRVYRTDRSAGKVWMIRPDGGKTEIDSNLNGPTGIALSPDGLWLAVAESKTHWGYSYRIQPNGALQGKQRFYWFHVPDEADNSGAGSWVMDREGRLYAATRLGVQVFDRNGRVRAILPVPGGAAVDLKFGGESLETLYVNSTDGKIYRRRFKVPGIAPGAAPIELPPGNPG
jgi:gluconolactonase